MGYRYEIVELHDYPRICEMMRKYGKAYQDEDETNAFMSIDKTCYGMLVGGELRAFGCILHYEGQNIVTYTWSDGTFTSKRAYVKLYAHVRTIYGRLFYGSTALKYNKARRHNNAK